MEEAKRPYVKTFSCPNCAGSVNIRAIGSSINVVCTYCSSIIDTNDENYKVVDTFTNKIKRRQVIGLGERGELFGTLWEVIGYMERVEQSGTYTWSEYLLFNPLKGFRWLTEYNGHWSFVTTIKDNPELHPPVGNLKGTNLIVPDYAWFKNRQYSLFSNGTAKVTFVIGEFYWQVRIGETVNMQEFIAPPETLTLEKNSEEINWSVGFYTNADTIKTAFRVETMPFQNGVAPNQPSPLGEEVVTKIKKYWKYFSYAILLIQIGFCLGTKSEVAYKGQIQFSPYDTQKTKVTPPFEIKDGTTTLEINFSSPVNNSWLEIGVDLVNDDNGDTVEFEQGIEYYSGTDSDGAWSKFSTWLYKIVVNTALSKTRRKKLSVSDNETAAIEEVSIEGIENAYAKLAHEEQRRIINAALDEMNMEDRLLLTLFHLQELSLDEIMEITGIPKENIKVKLHRARKKMFSILENQLGTDLKNLI